MYARIVCMAMMVTALVCCSNRPRISTPEQEKWYNALQVSFIAHEDVLSMMTSGTDDSTRLLVNDVMDMDIEDFAYKHQMDQKALDELLKALDLSRQIIESLDRLRKKAGR